MTFYLVHKSRFEKQIQVSIAVWKKEVRVLTSRSKPAWRINLGKNLDSGVLIIWQNVPCLNLSEKKKKYQERYKEHKKVEQGGNFKARPEGDNPWAQTWFCK